MSPLGMFYREFSKIFRADFEYIFQIYCIAWPLFVSLKYTLYMPKQVPSNI